MRFIKQSASFLTFLLVFFNATAQTSNWTLQQCIDYALAHNIQVKQSELNSELYKSQYDQSVANLFPNLNGNASQNYFFGRSIDPTTNIFTNQQIKSNSFSLTSSVSLFEGFQLQNTLQQSHLNFLSSQFDLKKIRNDMSLNIVTEYLQVLYNQDLLQTTTGQLEATRNQRDRTKRMEELGSVSRGTLLDMEAQLSADEVRQVNAQAQLDQSMVSLKQLLELDTVKDFSIQKPEVVIPELNAGQINTDVIYAEALNTQPEIKSQEYKVYSAEKGLSIAKGGRYPRLFLSAGLSTSYSSESKDLTGYTSGSPTSSYTGYTSGGDSVFTVLPNLSPVFTNTSFNDQLDQHVGKSIGFTLQVPIFNGWSVKSNVDRAYISLSQARLTQESTKKNLYKSIQQASTDAVSSYRKLDASNRSVESLREAFNFNQQRFEIGLISTYDFLQSKNNLAKAEADLLQARYDYIFRLKILDFYQGKPLTF